jgi:hypothetical protein
LSPPSYKCLQCTSQPGSSYHTVPFLFPFLYTNITTLFPSADMFQHCYIILKLFITFDRNSKLGLHQIFPSSESHLLCKFFCVKFTCIHARTLKMMVREIM